MDREWWIVLTKIGSGFHGPCDSLEQAEDIRKHFDIRYPGSGPHEIVHVVESGKQLERAEHENSKSIDCLTGRE